MVHMCVRLLMLAIFVVSVACVHTPIQASDVVMSAPEPQLGTEDVGQALNPFLAEAEQEAAAQEGDGSPEFSRYIFLLKSDKGAIEAFYAGDGRALVDRMQQPPPGLMSLVSCVGPYFAAAYARTRSMQAGQQPHAQTEWRRREYIATRLLLERIIADRKTGWHTLAMIVVVMGDDHRMWERYRDIALAPRSAKLLGYVRDALRLDRNTLEQDVEVYDQAVSLCANVGAKNTAVYDEDAFYAVQHCAFLTLEAVYVAEKRASDKNFPPKGTRLTADHAYLYMMKLTEFSQGSRDQERTAILAARIAREYGLGDAKQRAAVQVAMDSMLRRPDWNFIPEQSTPRQILALIAEWKMGQSAHDAACNAFFVKARHDWYRDQVVLHECGGDVRADELQRISFPTQVPPYLEAQLLERLHRFPLEDLVRDIRARKAECESLLPATCSMGALSSCRFVVGGLFWTSECSQAWLEATALSADVNERQRAAGIALEFLRLDAEAAQAGSRVQNLDKDTQARFAEVAERALQQGLLLITVERLGAVQERRFSSLLAPYTKGNIRKK